MRVTPYLNNFTGGTLSPKLLGRTDLDLYKNGLEDSLNILTLVFGGVTRRQGSYYVASTKDPTKLARLIKFRYSTEQAYILEFGHNYVRFYMDGGQIGAPYEVVTPYGSTELDEIQIAQSADTMYIAHPSYTVRKMTRTGHAAWTIIEAPFVWTPFLDTNTTATTITPSAVTGVGITLTASAATFLAGHVGSFWKIEGNRKTADSFTSAVAGTSEEIEEGDSLICSLNGTWAGTCTLQRSYDDGTTWLDYAGYTANTAFEIIGLDEDILYRWDMSVFTSGTCEAALSKPESPGYAEVTAYTSTTVVTATVIEELPSTDATINWAEGAWSAVQGYPKAVTFFEQRLVFAATTGRPQTIWASQSGDFESFEAGANDADAWWFTIASNEVNSIEWIVSGEKLFLGSAGGVWVVGTRGEGAVTATNIDVNQQTTEGTDPIQPIKIGKTIIYIQDGGKKVLALTYSFEKDSYVAVEISKGSEHLFTDGITAMVYQAQPDPYIWFIVGGSLVSCAYDPNNKINAYNPHNTTGTVESIAVIPGSDRDELWMVANRTINSSTTRYVEQFQTDQWDTVEDSIYMDSAITYSGVAATTISGLDHLEGEEVTVLADGAIRADHTVSSGSITLARSAEKVQIGLEYLSYLKTVRIDSGAQAGTAQSKRKNIFNLNIRFHETIGANAGESLTNLDPIEFRKGSDPMDAAPPLFSGDKEQLFNSGANRDGQIYITQSQPYPWTVLAIAPVVYTSDL